MQRWNPNEDMQGDPRAIDGWLAEAQRNALTMDKIADPKVKAAEPPVLIETKPGDRLEDAYAERGVLLRATEAGATVEVSGEGMQSFSSGRCLQTKKSDLEVRFALPGVRGITSAGVLHAGAIVRTLGPGSVGIAAYDNSGRLLAQILNVDPPDAVPGQGRQRDEFIGIRSNTPVTRLRIFRAGALKENAGDVILDDLVFDRIAPAGLREDQCRLRLASGDRLVGKQVESAASEIALKVEFLGDHAEPLKFKLTALSSFEPRRAILSKAPVDGKKRRN